MAGPSPVGVDQGSQIDLLFLRSQPLISHFRSTILGSWKAAGLPAIIYAFQNLLMLQGTYYLDGLTLNLINQTKIIFTAICVYLVLGKPQSGVQCIALLMLFASSILLTLEKPAGGQGTTDYESWLYLGVVPVATASVLSGIASALSQRSLQVERQGQAAWIVPVQLSKSDICGASLSFASSMPETAICFPWNSAYTAR